MGGVDEEEGEEEMKKRKLVMIPDECRWCDYFVPRALMCVELRSGSKGMPLRRRADDSCIHFVKWKASDAILGLQTRDRLNALPRIDKR